MMNTHKEKKRTVYELHNKILKSLVKYLTLRLYVYIGVYNDKEES